MAKRGANIVFLKINFCQTSKTKACETWNFSFAAMIKMKPFRKTENPFNSVQRLKYQECVTKHIRDKLHTNCNTEWVVSLENPIDTLYKMDLMNSDVSACVSVNLTCKHYRFYLDHLFWMCCNLWACTLSVCRKTSKKVNVKVVDFDFWIQWYATLSRWKKKCRQD